MIIRGVIKDVHPDDMYYSDRHALIGTIIELQVRNMRTANMQITKLECNAVWFSGVDRDEARYFFALKISRLYD